jgi:hypothetical protein
MKYIHKLDCHWLHMKPLEAGGFFSINTTKQLPVSWWFWNKTEILNFNRFVFFLLDFRVNIIDFSEYAFGSLWFILVYSLHIKMLYYSYRFASIVTCTLKTGWVKFHGQSKINSVWGNLMFWLHFLENWTTCSPG